MGLRYLRLELVSPAWRGYQSAAERADLQHVTVLEQLTRDTRPLT